MGNRRISHLLLVAAIAALGILACDASALTSQFGIGGTSLPTITIDSPAAGSTFREGEDIVVQSTSRDSKGIVRVELLVDGAPARVDAPPVPQGQAVFSLVQIWKAKAGNHTLSVRAFSASGAASNPAVVAVVVTTPSAQGPTSTLVIPPSPTLTPLGPTTQFTLTPQASATHATTAPTVRPPTLPGPTRTPTIIPGPPGVYAQSIRVDPPAPKRGQAAIFIVTFVNTTGAPQDYRWRVNIYEPEKRNAFGDTAPVASTINPGRQELASADNWAVRGPGDCMNLIARVFWIDPSSKAQTEFAKPDGSPGPATGFQVCP